MTGIPPTVLLLYSMWICMCRHVPRGTCGGHSTTCWSWVLSWVPGIKRRWSDLAASAFTTELPCQLVTGSNLSSHFTEEEASLRNLSLRHLARSGAGVGGGGSPDRGLWSLCLALQEDGMRSEGGCWERALGPSTEKPADHVTNQYTAHSIRDEYFFL